MNKFLTFETNSVRINNSVFPSESVSIDLKADTTNVYDINGHWLGLSPNGPIQGQLTTQFYLTGTLPSYLTVDGQSEVPVKIKFNNFYIPSAYLTDFSFSADPFSPILASASFVFFHGLSVLDANHADTNTAFNSSLGTLNGLSSYIVASNRETYNENPNNFLITNFKYSFSVDRSPVLRVKQTVPSRVAMKQINVQVDLTSNNLDGKLKINGNSAILSAYLRDSQNSSIYTAFNITGTILNQSYSLSSDSYGVASATLLQTINQRRNLLSIPFETEDNNLNYDLKEEYAEIPVIDDPVYPPPPNDPPIIVNGNINSERTYQVVLLFKFPFTSRVYNDPGVEPTNPCNDEKGYASPLVSVSSFDVNGYRFNFSPKDSNTKYAIMPSYEESDSLPIYERQFIPPNYYVGSISFNQNFLDYVNDNTHFTETFPTIIARDDYGNEIESMCYLFSYGYEKIDGSCVAMPRTLHTLSWSVFFGKLLEVIQISPDHGDGSGSTPYIIKFGFGE